MSMIDVMRSNSYYREIIDWETFERKVIDAAYTDPSLFTSIEKSLSFLGDNLSYFETESGSRIRSTPVNCFAEIPEGSSLSHGINYVKIPDLRFNETDNRQIAENLISSIRSADTAGVKGWVIDLRNNGSESFWGTLIAISPFLDSEIAGYGIASSGDKVSWQYSKGEWTESSGGNTFVTVSLNNGYSINQDSAKIAILVDGKTSQAAEAAVVMLIGQSNVRTIGLPTCGSLAQLKAFRLIDGSFLHLVTGLIADRKGKVYDSSIIPDITERFQSKVWEKALFWLSE